VEDKISAGIRNKANLLLNEGKVKKEFETDKRIHFKVEGETETHSVILDKEKNEFSCDCKYFTLHNKICSHAIAAKLLIGSK